MDPDIKAALIEGALFVLALFGAFRLDRYCDRKKGRW